MRVLAFTVRFCESCVKCLSMSESTNFRITETSFVVCSLLLSETLVNHKSYTQAIFQLKYNVCDSSKFCYLCRQISRRTCPSEIDNSAFFNEVPFSH